MDTEEYSLIIDYGKPYVKKCKNLTELIDALTELYHLDKKGELPFLDITIYNKEEVDITKSIQIDTLFLSIGRD